ncbi:MAG: tRNA epoxyqueuosine(34) reductase QueG, partial [Paraperlucidibaca sp.]
MTRIPLHDNASLSPTDLLTLKADIALWARELGFQQTGISGIDLGEHPEHMARWLAQGYEAGMTWLHEPKRLAPAELVPNTQRIISLRMDYLPAEPRIHDILADADRAYIARYALGRDYHKIIRKRVQKLADRIAEAIGPFGYRAFVDSAPVLEKAIAAQAGLGWIGKHTVVLNRHAGSYFFLAELFTDLPLPVDAPVTSHCGSCSACIDVCPTQAIIAPYVLDAGKCISYLTIEYRGVIAEPLRRAIGNRIFGCDDCQLVCPWNRYAQASQEPAFTPRHAFDGPPLLDLWAWDEATWLSKTEGMPLRRMSYASWLRNLSMALGNAPASAAIVHALSQRRDELSHAG